MKGVSLMNSAKLHNGKIITAKEYNSNLHGTRIYCIDKACHNVPVIYIKGNETTVPHFRTSGHNNSKHHEGCGFYKPLSFEESIQKVKEYQQELLDQGVKENIIRLNLNKLDPDYVKSEVDREEKEKRVNDPTEIKIKQDAETPASISSLKSVVKLFSTYEPDILSSILVNIKGKKIPISQLILSTEQAHNLLWNGESIDKLNYFVYGTVENVQRREKVYYINFKRVNDVFFSLVVFDKYFKHFTYSDEELIGKQVLAWGGLAKNTFNEKNTTIMAIKSNRYIEYVPEKKM